MGDDWYFARGEITFGPFSAADIREKAACGLLAQNDLIWQGREGRAGAIEAQGAVDFSSLPKISAPKPDWLNDVAAAETAGPVPDPVAGQAPPVWLDDLRLWYGLELYAAAKAGPPSMPTAAPAGDLPDWLDGWLTPVQTPARTQGASRPAQRKTPIPLPLPARPANSPATSLVAKAIEETGFDPQTGRILDTDKFRKWQRTAHSAKAAVTNESLFEVFRKGRIAIENWVDDDCRRQLILSGDMARIKKDATLVAVFDRYQSHGAALREKLDHHLEFMVENRRKFYAAAAQP